MNRKAIFVSIMLACLSVVVASAAILLRPHRTADLNALITPQPATELKAPDTFEYMEKRFPRQDGKIMRTEVTFRNGHRGERFFTEIDKLREVRIVDQFGQTFAHMTYAEDGVQPVNGFERRDDGTLRRTVAIENGFIVARLYWQDGVTLFAEIRREIPATDGPAGDAYYRWWNHRNYTNTFYHRNGKLWARQVSTYIAYEVVMLKEEVFDSAGRLMKAITRDAEGAGEFAHYRPDGTASYRQVIAIHKTVTAGGNEDGSDYVVKARVLRELHLFNEAGNPQRVVYMDDLGKEVVRIDNIRGDDVVRPNNFVLEAPWRIWGDEPVDPMATWKTVDGQNTIR